MGAGLILLNVFHLPIEAIFPVVAALFLLFALPCFFFVKERGQKVLDYTDATFSCHDALQLMKTHPFIKKILEGGKRVAWGAKTIPSGGYFSMPKRLAVPGMVIAGDAASMVNVPTLKGVHYAMHAGMYAAETIVDALKQDPDAVNFEAYDEKVHNSLIEKEIYESRNMRQPFSKGFFVGGALASMMTVTKGRMPNGRFPTHPNAAAPLTKAARQAPMWNVDGWSRCGAISSSYCRWMVASVVMARGSSLVRSRCARAASARVAWSVTSACVPKRSPLSRRRRRPRAGAPVR